MAGEERTDRVLYEEGVNVEAPDRTLRVEVRLVLLHTPIEDVRPERVAVLRLRSGAMRAGGLFPWWEEHERRTIDAQEMTNASLVRGAIAMFDMHVAGLLDKPGYTLGEDYIP